MSVLTVLTIGFLLAYGVQVIYYLYSVPGFNCSMPSTNHEKVSVIVAARNEECNIETLITSILCQSHANFELIIADDNSEDDTCAVIKRYLDDPRVRLIKSPSSFYPQKKQALTRAIAAATSDILFITDADCIHPEQWIASMLEKYKEGHTMVCGPVRIISDSLWSGLQALEFSGLIAVTASSIEKRNPHMCNGANLVFSRQVFQQVGGYDDNEHIASGDDIFLMNKINKLFPGSIGFCNNSNAIVSTRAQGTLSSFMSQRIRWSSKMTKVRLGWKANVLAGSVIGLNLILFLLAAISIISGKFVILFFTSLLVKSAFDGIFLFVSSRNLNQQKLMMLLPFFVIMYVPYVIALIAGSVKGSYFWKGRLVKI
jgi:poly-beta-1,6-N-acetyl-D-glucosamine synthase